MRYGLAALVLAGGRGRRLGGRDKALVDVGGRTMLDRVLSAVLGTGADPVIVVGPERAVAAEGIVFTSEEASGGGPVPAVAAGLACVGDAGLVVLCPVDVPLLGPEDLSRLVHTLESAPDAQVVAAADHRGGPNPLLAVYRHDALTCGLAAIAAHKGSAASLLLSRASVVVVDLGRAAMNVNSPDDLSAARRFAG